VDRSDVQAGTTGWHGTDADTGAVLAADAAGKKVEVTFVSAKQLKQSAEAASAANAKASAGAIGYGNMAKSPTTVEIERVARFWAAVLAIQRLQIRQRMAGPVQTSCGRIVTGPEAGVFSHKALPNSFTG
jgi:hypothetical protein